jgi:beta-glucosidase
MPEIEFPGGFLWGAATASYQIEGAANEDGRGKSVWDTFSHTPGKTAKGETGDVACDHYHRFAQDAAMIGKLRIPNYRFSIAWPRVLPNGEGAVNPKGIEFYNRLVDTLLANNVNPVITLFHWDYPQALEDRGGWAAPEAAKWFGDYAEVIFRAFGDRVKYWITHNEPWCHAHLGNESGIHAPGNKSAELAYKVGHGLLLGHGEAVRRYRELGCDGKIGITTNHYFGMPYSDSPEDLKAKSQFDDWNVGWFLDPVYFGDYPEFLKQRYPMPEFTPEQRALVSEKTDFMGLNFYQGDVVRWNPAHRNDAEQIELRKDNTTQMGWQRVPETLTYSLIESQKRYNPETILITENGCAYEDKVCGDSVDDPLRVQFIRDYIRAAGESLQHGVKLGGYFAWSLMDNYEWAEGYRPTFGLVHVDYETQKRTPKASALMYGDIIRANSI